jgi:hypothetical protein
MGVRTKKRDTPVYFCDVCLREDNMSYGSGGKCLICEIDVCGRCSVPAPDDYSDYPERYCHRCWEIGKPFWNEMIRIDSEAETAKAVQMAKWRAAVAIDPREKS